MTFDSFEDDVMFTRAALSADENAADLLPLTDDQLPQIDEVRSFDRNARQQIANIDASRTVANTNLDIHCTAFGDSLYLSCNKDRSSTRWTQFFREQVSRFTRQRLTDQVRRVLGWLQTSTDETLEAHRTNLTKWAQAADVALNSTEGQSGVRAQVWQRREVLAKSLTDARDNLHATLLQRAQQRKLPRDWADSFFRVVRKGEDSTTSVPPEKAATTAESTSSAASEPASTASIAFDAAASPSIA